MVTEHQPGIFTGFEADHARRTLRDAEFIVPHLRPGMKLLDVGCGSGTITVELATVVAPASVVGIDLSPERIEAARSLARARGIENVSFQVEDLCRLPFSDAEFDAVFESMVFMHMPDPAAGVREVFRVLKPGGLFGGRDTESDGFVANWGDLLQEFMGLLLKYRSFRGSNDAIGKSVPGMLRAAGFNNIEVSSRSLTFGTVEQRRTLREQYVGLATEPDFVPIVSKQAWADEATIHRMLEAFDQWIEEPDAFHARLSVVSIASKPI